MKKITNCRNYDHKTTVNERYTKPSLTIPGQTLSLQQLLERYVRGSNVERFNGVYTHEVPPGMENLTKIEKIEMARNLKNNVQDIRKTLQEIEINKAGRQNDLEDGIKEAKKEKISQADLE